MARDLATDDAVIMEGSIWMVMESGSRNGKGEIDQKEIDKFPVHRRVETGLLDQPKKDTVLLEISPKYRTW
jgi:hypothetical protein